MEVEKASNGRAQTGSQETPVIVFIYSLYTNISDEIM